MSKKRNPFYEKEFPSLSEVQVKNNASNRDLLSQNDLFSYSARLKTSSIEKSSNNVNIEEIKCSSAQFPLKTRTFNQHCGTQTENVQSNINSYTFSKNQKPSNKIYKRPSYNEINCDSTKCPTHIQSFRSSDKEVKNAVSDEGWTTVRKKLPTDQAAQSYIKPKLTASGTVGISNDRYATKTVSFLKSSVDRCIGNAHSNAKVDGTNENKPLPSGYAKSNVDNSKHSHKSFSVQGKEDHRFRQSNFKSQEKDDKFQAPQHISNSNYKIVSFGKKSGNDFHKSSSNSRNHCDKNQSTKVTQGKRTDNYSFRNGEQVTEKNSAQMQFSGSNKVYPQNTRVQHSSRNEQSKNNQMTSQYFQVSGMKNTRDAEFKNSTNTNSSNKKLCTNQSHPISNPSDKKLNSSKKENNKSVNTSNIADLHSIESSKKKKKRKSKVKREAAAQSDKIRIVTPEMHSKIMNLSNKESVQPQKNVAVNINDCFEYPELGANVIQKSKSGNVASRGGMPLKKDILDSSKKYLKVEKDNLNFTISESTMDVSLTQKGHGKTIELSENEDECLEKEKLPVHFNDPITISLFDMLLAKKTKKKEPVKYNVPMGNSIHKTSMKKQLPLFSNRQVVNPLDSSKPAVKRGKERENPKPKRTSQLKKIILMDRKRRKEHVLAQSIIKESQSTIEEGDSTKFNFSFNLNSIDKFKGNTIIQPDTPSDIFDLETNASDLKVPETIHLNVDNNLQPFMTLTESNGYCDQITDSHYCADMPKTDFGRHLKENIDPQNYEKIPSNDFKTNLTTSDINCIKFEIIADNVELSQNYKHSHCNSNKICNDYTLEEKKLVPNTVNDENVFSKFSVEEKLIPQSETNNTKVVVESSKSHFDNSCNILASNQPFRFYEKYFHTLSEMTCIECSKNQKNICNDTITINKPLFKIKNKTSLSKKLKTWTAEPGLNYIRYLFKDLESLKRHSSEEFICDEFLTDIQYLFTDKNNSEFSPGDYFSTITANTNLTSQEENNILVSNKYNTNAVTSQLTETVLENNENCFEETEACEENISNSAEDSVKNDFGRRYSDQEILGAALIVLHSKKFREYCTQFLSKSLDDTVFALLDDLARFQDRMHQKDKVKARMKRRMLYGIKEITKHMTLKKLKCIIIATDVEDSGTEGGLNDLLKKLKSLAKDCHIPCVFSHLRKKLGQVCRKRVTVSAVGILNYEGSEGNFKKMMEFQNECKIDYAQVLKCLTLILTDEQIDSLYKTKEEDMANLHNVTTALLRTYFPKPGGTSVKISNVNSNADEKNVSLSNYADLKTLSISPNTLLPNESLAIRERQQHLVDTEEALHIYNILLKYKIVNY